MPTGANNGDLEIMVYAKAIMAVVIIVTICYCQIMQIPLEGAITQILLILIGAQQLYSAKLYRDHVQNRKPKVFTARTQSGKDDEDA